MAINLNAIISQAAGLAEEQRQQTQQMASMQMQQGEIGQRIAQNIRDEGDLRMGAELVEQEALMRARNAARANATSMGMNAIDSGEIISQLSEQMRLDAIAYQAADQKVQNIERNSNLLSNPGGWLVDLLHGDQARAERDALAARHETTASQLNNMHSLTQQNVQTQMAIAETATADSIRDVAEANRLLAESNANKAEVDAMSYSVEAINTLRTFGSEEFNRRLQLYNSAAAAARHADQMEASRQNLELQRRRLEREESEDAAWEYTAANVNRGRTNLGLEPLPAGVIRRSYGENTAQGEAIREADILGQASIDRASSVVGLSPGHAAHLAITTGGSLPQELDDEVATNLQTAYSSTLTALEEQRANRIAQGQNIPANFGSPEHIIEEVNNRFRAAQENSDRDFGLRSMPVSTILSEYPQLSETAVYRQVIQPLQEANAQVSAKELAERVAASYAEGQLTENEATSGLVSFSRANIDLYNAFSGRTSIGAFLKSDFTVGVTTGAYRRAAPGVLGSVGIASGNSLKSRNIDQELNVTNPTDVGHYLQRYRSNVVARQMQDGARNQR